MMDSKTVQIRKLPLLWTQAVNEYVVTAASPSTGEFVAVGAADGSITVFEQRTGRLCQQWNNLHPLGVLAVSWSADGSVLASSGQDSYIHLLSVSDTTPLKRFKAGDTWVEHLVWHATEPKLLSACGKQLRVWASTGDLLFEFAPHDYTISGLAWHPGLPTQLATATYNGIRRYEVGKTTPLRKFAWKSSLQKLVWSPDAKVLATSTQDAAVHVWYAKTGDDLHMGGYPSKIKAMAWQSDSRYLAVAGGIEVTLWDFSGRGPAGTEPVLLSAHTEPVTALVFEPKGTRLVTGSQDGQLFVWEAEKRTQPPLEPLLAFPLGSGITQLLWQKDATIIATSENGNIAAFAVND